MTREVQGLVKYDCRECEKEFLVGAKDEAQSPPKMCPFCGYDYIEDLSSTNPEEPPDWLEEMG